MKFLNKAISCFMMLGISMSILAETSANAVYTPLDDYKAASDAVYVEGERYDLNKVLTDLASNRLNDSEFYVYENKNSLIGIQIPKPTVNQIAYILDMTWCYNNFTCPSGEQDKVVEYLNNNYPEISIEIKDKGNLPSSWRCSYRCRNK